MIVTQPFPTLDSRTAADPLPRRADPNLLGRRVKQLRHARGWSQEELAARAGVSRGTVTEIEKQDGRGNWDTACKLANALAVSLVELAADV